MPDILTHVLPVERIVFSSSLVCAGLFRCRADDEHFPGGRPCSAHSIVFPRESVWIQHEYGRRFVGDPSVVTLYNRGETYRRWSIGGRPDRCDWLAFPDTMLRGAVREVAPADADAPRGPLRATSTPISAALYAAQRQLFLHLKTNPAGTEAMPVEERAMALLSAVLRSAYATKPQEPRQTRRSLDAVEQLRERIAADISRRHSLAELVEGVGISAYHACRVFRAMTGTTISGYRAQLRVRAALEPVLAGDDLSATALSLGFDSHSHFTCAFRRAYGVPPSEIRRVARTPGAFSRRSYLAGS